VGTGFDEAERRRLEAELEPLASEEDPFADLTDRESGLRFVRPERVCAVEFGEFTEAGRLRAPAYQRLCPEADPRSPLIEDLRDGRSA
jgi:bifunctional non-homologous end joining protein LigD